MTAMSTTTHDWKLVAPWYRWERVDDIEQAQRAAEADRPVIQKFVSDEFVAEFLDDPQRSVVYDPKDERQEVVDADMLVGPGLVKRLSTLSGTKLQADGTRKLFLPAHQRFYIATVGLHCDRPGFPRVDPASVDEIGFVIRRHRTSIPEDAEPEIAKQLHAIAGARAKATVQAQYDRARARARSLRPFGGAARRRVASPSAATVAAAREVEIARRKLRSFAVEAGVETSTEGWVPTGEGSFGAWVPIDDPDELIERTYPMRQLVAAPDDPDHAAVDGTIFFASVPTNSDEVDSTGSHRFDERHTYELVVYARRDDGPCPGPLVWSKPTLKFTLASFYDPDGCAQRPTEVRLPDFKQLAASTARPSVKMTAPVESALPTDFGAGIPAPGSKQVDNGSEEICFFSIPLITIVALFLLNIVLPIVVLVFSLWWMLALKFCIPPSADIALGFEAEADWQGGEFSMEAALEFVVDETEVVGPLVDHYNATSVGASELTPPDSWGVGDGLKAATPKISNEAILGVLGDQGLDSETGGVPDFTTGVTRHERVTFEQVVHPVVYP